MATTPLPGVITRSSPFRTTPSFSSPLLSAHCVEPDFFILKGHRLVLHFLPLSLPSSPANINLVLIPLSTNERLSLLPSAPTLNVF